MNKWSNEMNIRRFYAAGAVAWGAATGFLLFVLLTGNIGLPLLESNIETLEIQNKPVLVLNTNETCTVIHCGTDEVLLMSRAERHPELIIRKSAARGHYLAIYVAGQVQLPVYAASSEALSDDKVDRVLKRAYALSVLEHQLNREMQPFEEAIFKVGYEGDQAALEAQRQKIVAAEGEATASTRHQIQVIFDELTRLLANVDD
jgi:hypothetical protein